MRTTSLKSDSFTETEILGQLELWLKLWKHFQSVKFDLKNYLDKVLENKETRIILSDAGTSAFIGNVLIGTFNKSFNILISAVAATDLITYPELYFNKTKKFNYGKDIISIAVVKLPVIVLIKSTV